MSITKKLKVAFSIARSGGPLALLKAFLKYCRPWGRLATPNESRIAFKVLDAHQSTGTMVDVGAHIGGTLGPFAHAGWQIFAFEPDSENRRKLVEAFGEIPNVTIDCRALSNTTYNAATLYRSEESTGISGLSAFHSSHVPGETIDVTTLECICQENQICHIDFLKIDTEGFDLFVLNGIPWEKLSPRFILCEFEDSKTMPLGYSFHDLADFLMERGYKLVVSEWYPIERYGGPHQWRCFSPYPCEMRDSDGWGNIFAVKEEHLYKDLLKECEQIIQS